MSALKSKHSSIIPENSDHSKAQDLKIKQQKLQIDMLTKDLVNNEAKMESQAKEIERIRRISLLEVESLTNQTKMDLKTI